MNKYSLQFQQKTCLISDYQKIPSSGYKGEPLSPPLTSSSSKLSLYWSTMSSLFIGGFFVLDGLWIGCYES